MITDRLYLKTPKAEDSLVLIELRKDGQKIRLSTGITIKTEHWNETHKVLLKTHPDYLFTSQKLLAFTSIVAREMMKAEANEEDLDTLKAAILTAMGRADNTTAYNKGVLKFYKWWAMNSFGDHNPTRQNWNHYVVFEEFCRKKEIAFEDVDYEFYLKFKAFLDNNKGYKPNTTATHLRDLKAVMSEARNRGMHNSTNYLAIKKKFENVDTTYMTIEEINKLYKYKLTGVKAMARDLFVLGCHTAMRYSDYSQLTIAHIAKGNITYRTQKTDETVIIPAHPRVIEILEKWGGSAPKVSNTSLNKMIKEICQEMKIFNDLVPVREGKEVKYMERWSIISTHTARRSGATNMYLSKIPVQSIMKITGHTTEDSFMKYLRITKEENANLLAKNKFFRK